MTAVSRVAPGPVQHVAPLPEAVDDDSSIVIRAATPKEIAEVVVPAWISSYSRSLIAKWMRADGRYGAGRDAFWSAMRLRVDRILSTAGVRVIVAEVDGMVASWICEDPSRRRIHYVYTKDPFRRQGFARRLIPDSLEDGRVGVVTLTHQPPPWYSMRDRDTGAAPKWREHVLIDLLTEV